MLFYLRAGVAFLTLTALTATFLGLLALPLNFFAFLPALVAANFLVLAVLLLLTALLGRVYCAVLCPLGIFQDIVFGIKKCLRPKKVKFAYCPEAWVWRYGILALLLLAWLFGLAYIPALLDPYSIYGRMVTNLLTPVWQQGFNAVAALADKKSLWLVAKYELVFPGTLALGVAAAYFLLLTILAWRCGRLYCQTICPVGTMLGTISRFAWLHLKLDAAKCVGCGQCERHCRSACIDVQHNFIDSSRCILCLECVNICPAHALYFGTGAAQTKPEQASKDSWQGPLVSRRALLLTSGVALGTAVTGLARGSNSLALLGTPEPKPIMPPGAGTSRQFLQKCTACQLCINRCPEQVLRPAEEEYGLAGKGKPWLDYTRGYCNFNCKLCSSLCPTTALAPLALAAKQRTKIGMAQYAPQHCLIPKEGVICGNCAVHCPTKAITMKESKGLLLPQINFADCIGCGSCEYHCPATPKAMRVLGLNK